MMQRIEKLITDFVEDTGLTERHEIIHGTLYATLKDPKERKTYEVDVSRLIRVFVNNRDDNKRSVK